MKHSIIPTPLITFLLTLYPICWRKRYEEEFRDVLEQCSLSPPLIVDVCRGAVCAHFTFGREARKIAARRERSRRRAMLSVILLIGLAPAMNVYGKPRTVRPLPGIFC